MSLVRLAITRLMPTEEPRLRISVHSAAPSVRISPGRVAKAMVLSGTNTNPRPTPWPMLSSVDRRRRDLRRPADHQVQRDGRQRQAEEHHQARVDLAGEPPDHHHREERADAARAEEIAAGQHGIAHQVLDVGRHQRHGGEQDDADQEHEDQRDGEIPVAEDAQRDERALRGQRVAEEEIEADARRGSPRR